LRRVATLVARGPRHFLGGAEASRVSLPVSVDVSVDRLSAAVEATAYFVAGLGGLEDRVSALGGRLVVESPPREGTRVCAQLPVSDPG
jgi:glucose-6-phosphate-specific signal transduction histidine kinase